MEKFKNVRSLQLYLLERPYLAFESKPRVLTQKQITMFSMATEDFNPAHCIPEFAKHSIFESVVSHGIATLARAEAEFLQLLQFEDTPVEIIAIGIDRARYLAPLKLGAMYKYKFEISDLRTTTEYRWKMACKIQCIVASEETETIIVDWVWKPMFIEHPEVPTSYLKMLKPTGYAKSVFNVLVLYPILRIPYLRKILRNHLFQYASVALCMWIFYGISYYPLLKYDQWERKQPHVVTAEEKCAAESGTI